MDNLIILADGEFPVHEKPLSLLMSSGNIVCCDGAAGRLTDAGVSPMAIVGDMDSLEIEKQQRYNAIIHKSDDQEANDLTKAFINSLELNPGKITILGATGLREDHTIGNISLLSHYSGLTSIPVEMWTNSGIFISVKSSCTINAFKGCQVSVFSLDSDVKIKSEGLKYPLDNVSFDSWWKGTLNECQSVSFSLTLINEGRVIIFLEHPF